MQSTNKMTENQQKVQIYFDKNRIEEILSDMLNTMAHVMMKDPLPFMVTKHNI